MIFMVFWVKYELKNRFLVQNNLNSNFPIITLGKFDDASSEFFFIKNMGRMTYCKQKKLRAQSRGATLKKWVRPNSEPLLFFIIIKLMIFMVFLSILFN
jgi:hypothetical protein